MNREQRLALIILTPTILLILAGYFVFSGSGLSSAFGGASGVEGEWVLTVPIDTEGYEYEEGEPDFVEVNVQFDRDESGGLQAVASSIYVEDEYPALDVSEIQEVDGQTSFRVEGWDNDPDSNQDKMTMHFYDQDESPGALEGVVEGEVGIYDPDVEGTFTGERR